MSNKLHVVMLSAALMVIGFVTKPAVADEWNKRTVFTFNQPVEIPGRVLSPGTYVFQLADSQADRMMVEIYNEDGTRLITTLLAASDERVTPEDGVGLTFERRAPNSPEAIQSWFYPGDDTGVQFLYSGNEHPTQVARTHGNSAGPAGGSH